MSPTGSGRVVVVGSGAAGMAAALSAACTGADVTLLERADVLGGTTAYSGGWPWVPNNPWAREIGATDSEEEARTYARSLDLGDWDWPRVDTYVRQAHVVMDTLTRVSPLRWTILDFPDYQAEKPGGKLRGRSLLPNPVAAGPEIAQRLRVDPTGRDIATDAEQATLDEAERQRRRREGVLARGRGLVAALLMAALERGVHIHTNARARALRIENGVVVGVTTDAEQFSGAVVLASGGFERDPLLAHAFLRGPALAPGGAPTNEGDGLRMAMAAGAALGNMSEAWWSPALAIPGERAGGAPYFRMLFTEYTRPGSLMVDRSGRRFADESRNYNDMGRALLDVSPQLTYDRIPAWLIFDAEHRRKYGVGYVIPPRSPDPEYLHKAVDLSGLAARIGVPAENLMRTIDRFNAQAERGVDEDFGRGTSPWGRHVGDRSAPHPNLAPLRTPPYYAVEVLPGCLGTKGGPRIDSEGRVLRADGKGPIPGLFAAGNVSASPFGFAYPGGGATIGPALTFGWLGGAAAARGEFGD
jgi:3-oxosteroid 1-dehydrogenase